MTSQKKRGCACRTQSISEGTFGGGNLRGLNIQPIATTVIYTGCLIKNASTHNLFIYYPISMNKKTKDMVFHALRSSHKIFFFGVIFSS
jgi:uncharacterized spore protein YtfJ